jgi:hypothetical protein
VKALILRTSIKAVPSTVSVRRDDFNATKSPRRSAGSSVRLPYSFGTVVLVPLVELVPVVEVGDEDVVHGVVLLVDPVVEAVPLVEVPLVLGVFAAEGVVPVLLQSVEVGLLVVPVVPDIEDEVDGDVEVCEALLPSLGVTPIEEPEFCWLLGVVPAAVPMPEVEVLGLVCGVAVLPAGVVLVVWSVIVAGVVLVVWSVIAGVVLELLMFPVAVELDVCPTPAGNVAVPPVLV